MTVALVGVAVFVAGLSIRIAALGIIPANRKPATGMAWLLAVLLSPLLGLIAFTLFGRTRLEKRRYARQQEAFQRIQTAAREAPAATDEDGRPPYVASVSRLNQRLGALPLQSANDVELFEDYQGSIAAMTEAIKRAEHYVNVEFYITAWDDMTEPLFAALVDATRRGVTVRLLFDHLGSRGIPGYKDMLKKLEATEIQWHRDAAGGAPQGRVPPAGSAQPPQARRRGRPTRLHRVAEPDRARVQQAEEPCRWAALGRADGAAPRPGRGCTRRRVRQRLVHRDRGSADRVRAGGAGHRRRRCPASRALPAGAERSGVPRREQPAHVHDPHLRGRTGVSRSPVPTSCPTSPCCTP